MADMDGDMDLESDIDMDDDDETEVDGEEEHETSLDDLYESEMIAETSSTAIEDDDEFIAKAMESAGDETTETLSFKVRPKAPGEFQCQSCFLVKHPSQLADADAQLCVDCV